MHTTSGTAPSVSCTQTLDSPVEFTPGSPPATGPLSRKQFINHLVILGAGDVVRTRLWPAVIEREGQFKTAICGLEPVSPFNTLPHAYFPVLPGMALPIEELWENGFAGSSTLTFVATPSHCHADCAIEAVSLGDRVACEKPLAADASSAHRLRPFCGRGRVLPLDHFLFKLDSHALRDGLWANPHVLRDLARIEFVFHETTSFKDGRHQEDTIADIQHHGFSLAVAILKITGEVFGLAVDCTAVGTHHPDPGWTYAVPQVTTASRVHAHAFLGDGRVIELDLRQAKGAPTNQKWLRLFDQGGGLIAEADLSESGHAAHGHMLDELLLRHPVLPLNLADAIGIMELVDQARRTSLDTGFHAFGQLPPFSSQIAGTESSAAQRPAAAASRRQSQTDSSESLTRNLFLGHT